MPTEAGGKEERPPLVADYLVEQTIVGFLERETNEQGRPNLLVDVITSSIIGFSKRYDNTFVEIGASLILQNTLDPDEKKVLQRVINDISPELSPEDRSMEISREIVLMEINKRRPDIFREDTERSKR